MCTCVSAWVPHMQTCACGSQRKALDTLKQESQVVMSHQTWVLGTYLEPSGRAVCALIAELSLQPPFPSNKEKHFYREQTLASIAEGGLSKALVNCVLWNMSKAWPGILLYFHSWQWSWAMGKGAGYPWQTRASVVSPRLEEPVFLTGGMRPLRWISQAFWSWQCSSACLASATWFINQGLSQFSSKLFISPLSNPQGF